MNPDDIISLLDELGDRLGPTGEYVFGLAVRQVVLECATWLIATAVLWVVFIVATPRIYRWQAQGAAYGSRDLIAMVYGVLVGGGLVLFTALSVVVAIPNLLNAEYVALEKLLDALP